MKIKIKKNFIFIIIAVILCIFFVNSNCSNSILAEVNNDYGEITESTADLEHTKGDVILDAIAGFIYVIAKIIEFFVTYLMEILTGSKIFPWADSVVFNTIPILDINFINPAPNSLFSGDNSFGNIIKNIYYILFVISMAFLGVVVGIMAVRLAISSIADEKAKYQKAIKDWVLALIMMFTVHYLISFIFFVNEKMVEVASTIFLEKAKGIDFNISSTVYTTYSDSDVNAVIEDFVDASCSGSTPNWFEYNQYTTKGSDNRFTIKLNNNKEPSKDGSVELWKTVVEYYIPYEYVKEENDNEQDKWAITGGLTFRLGDSFGALHYDVDEAEIYKNAGNDIKEVGNTKEKFKVYPNTINKDKYTKVWKRYMFYLIMNDTYTDCRRLKLEENNEFTSWFFFDIFDDTELYQVAYRCAYDALVLTAYDLDLLNIDYNTLDANVKSCEGEKVGNNQISEYKDATELIRSKIAYAAHSRGAEFIKNADGRDGYGDRVIDAMLEVWELVNRPTASNNDEGGGLVFSTMGSFFKSSAFGFELDESGKIKSYKKSEIQPVGAILYGIFIFLSLSFFFSYLKRLFYVIMLSLFAPIVIMYDFFVKTTS